MKSASHRGVTKEMVCAQEQFLRKALDEMRKKEESLAGQLATGESKQQHNLVEGKRTKGLAG